MTGPFRIDIFRGLRYWPVGIIGGILDSVVMTGVILIFGREYGVEAALAGALVGYPLSFVGHRYFTFGKHYTPLGRQMASFAVLKSPNLAARVFLFQELIVDNKFTLSTLLVVPLMFAWNFSMKRWIFTGTPPWRKAA